MILAETMMVLHQPESWFWDSEPRTVLFLLARAQEYRRIERKNNAIYNASYVWGHDIDDDDSPEPVAGVDYPADAELIDRLF